MASFLLAFVGLLTVSAVLWVGRVVFEWDWPAHAGQHKKGVWEN